jgi:hypothetical protein
MQNYNTDSTKPLPKGNGETKGNDEIREALPPEYQETSAKFSESEKESIRRRRWLESISDCV